MAKKRIIAGSPLTPIMLRKMGVFDNFPPSSEGFNPKGDWTNTYRILTCHGYLNDSNDNQGILKLRRTAVDNPKSFKLKVSQKIVNDEAILNVIDAEIVCDVDMIASPTKWNLSSRFTGSNQQNMPGLSINQSVTLSDGVMQMKTAGRTLNRKISGAVTSDWTLFEAIQRLAFKKSSLHPFITLEGLTLAKEQQRLFYEGLYGFNINGQDISLYRFSQLGSGILPYDYYLDEDHRLLLVVTGARAYILDDHADKAVLAYEQAQRKYYRSKARSSAGGKKK